MTLDHLVDECDDMRVMQPRHDPGLAPHPPMHPLAAGTGRSGGPLDRDRLTQFLVDGPPDDAHTPGTDLLLEPVPAGDQLTSTHPTLRHDNDHNGAVINHTLATVLHNRRQELSTTATALRDRRHRTVTPATVEPGHHGWVTSALTGSTDRPVIRGRQVILHRVLGGLFAVMAAFQLADLPGFVGVLEAFQLGGAGLAWALAVALLAGELVSGGWLLVAPGRRPLVPALVFAATSAIWSALAAQAFARGLVLDNCGCFGVYLAQPLRWWVLVQDAALLGYSALLLRAAGRARPAISPSGQRGTPPPLLKPSRP